MGAITYEMEVTSSIPPAKMFKAFVLDVDNLILRSFHKPLSSQFNYVKHWIDSLDKENFTYCYTIIEGDALMDNLESIYYEVKLVASPDGGSICKNISKYHTKGDIQITEDQIKAGKEKAMGMFKAIEAYLLANPDAY
ncbi:Major allergen Pru ar 1 [Vitis vinifera]|uniref:Major allergen Pru ar 1 n=1 Tax=Vitis vinifera TaxID=29760 RepID=A0A438IRH6_VITVI|nr:Major allergen Pru ar 1 [Vitis vinifera]